MVSLVTLVFFVLKSFCLSFFYLQNYKQKIIWKKKKKLNNFLKKKIFIKKSFLKKKKEKIILDLNLFILKILKKKKEKICFIEEKKRVFFSNSLKTKDKRKKRNRKTKFMIFSFSFFFFLNLFLCCLSLFFVQHYILFEYVFFCFC